MQLHPQQATMDTLQRSHNKMHVVHWQTMMMMMKKGRSQSLLQAKLPH
jgi:hypothetical protein